MRITTKLEGKFTLTLTDDAGNAFGTVSYENSVCDIDAKTLLTQLGALAKTFREEDRKVHAESRREEQRRFVEDKLRDKFGHLTDDLDEMHFMHREEMKHSIAKHYADLNDEAQRLAPNNRVHEDAEPPVFAYNKDIFNEVTGK